jgi:hypothetical protein
MIALSALSITTSGSSPNTTQPVMAAALLTGIGCGGAAAGKPSQTCTTSQELAGARLVEHVEVPKGASQCPQSGAGAACGNPSTVPEAGTPYVPQGLVPCPAIAGKPMVAPQGACTPEPAQPAPPAPVLGNLAEPAESAGQVTLSADHSLLAYGDSTTLDARATFSVGKTPWAIEIFDVTKSTLVGACSQSSDCVVAYKGKTGLHSFVAYVMTPDQSLPHDATQLTSNQAQVRWLGVGLLANPTVVAPGNPVTFTAYASEEVSALGYQIELRDSFSRDLLTYCTHGTTCSTSLIEPAGGTYAVIAALKPQSSAAQQAPDVVESFSGAVSGTWLSVHLDATVTGGVAHLTATANADLKTSPWSLYIFSASGQLLGQPCNASVCTATTPATGGDSDAYYATIAMRSAASSATGPLGTLLNRVAGMRTSPNVVARSEVVRPPHLMWGVDSCKAFTQDSPAPGILHAQVAGSYGRPDFWGRYLTTTYNCPGLSSAEIAAAHVHNMGILPIYDDYDCSAYSGYGTGFGYAASATAAAQALGIPAGTGIVVDIEPPGDACPGASFVDASFIEGWYDGVKGAGYVPVYYGDSTAGSAFAQGWCGAVASHPDYATTAYVWSFEPSLLGSYSKRSAPGFAPNGLGCPGDVAAWQYELSAGSTPDVDSDEALSRLPLWYP